MRRRERTSHVWEPSFQTDMKERQRPLVWRATQLLMVNDDPNDCEQGEWFFDGAYLGGFSVHPLSALRHCR